MEKNSTKSWGNRRGLQFCEIEQWNPKTDRGLPVSINPLLLKGQSLSQTAISHVSLRSLQKAVQYSNELKEKISTERFNNCAVSTKKKESVENCLKGMKHNQAKRKFRLVNSALLSFILC